MQDVGNVVDVACNEDVKCVEGKYNPYVSAEGRDNEEAGSVVKKASV